MQSPARSDRRRDRRLATPPTPALSAAKAVVFAAYPIWLEGMGKVVAGTGIGYIHLTTELADVPAAVAELKADLLVIALARDKVADLVGVIRHSRGHRPELRIVVISAAHDATTIDTVLDLGVNAFVLPTADPGDVAAAIRQSFGPSIYLRRSTNEAADDATGDTLPASIAVHERANGGGHGALNGNARERPDVTGPATRPVATDLTRRELEILRLATSGRSNSELARMLWVTEQTIKFHLSNIYRKLNVANRTEAARWAQVNGLLNDTPTASDDPTPVTAGQTAGALATPKASWQPNGNGQATPPRAAGAPGQSS